jgi:hypothetical protein
MEIKWRANTSKQVAARKADVYAPGEKTPLDLSDEKSVPQYVRDARDSMGMLARRKFDKANMQELRKMAGNIAVNYLAAERQLMLEKMAASVAIAQREIFKGFVDRAIEQDKELVEITSRAEKELTYKVEDEVMEVIQDKKLKIDQARVTLDGGKILPPDFDALCDMYAETAEQLIKSKWDKVNKVTQSYREHFEDAMKKYKEHALNTGKAITSS